MGVNRIGKVHSGEDVPMYWSTSRISILRLYSQYSAFVLAKQERIFDAVQPGGAVDRAIRRFRSQRDRIRASAERDPNFGQHMLFSTDLNLWSFDFDAYFDRYLRSFETTRDTLRSNLAEFPRGSWWPEAGGVRVVTRGPTALDSVQFRLVRGSPHPTQVAWDVDADGTLGPADLPLPFHISGGNVVVEATFMPNFLRFMTRNSLVRAQHYQSLIALQPAVFHIVADVPLNVDGVRARNPLTAESRALSKIPDEGMVPTRWNVPVTTKPRNLEETWSGRVVVNEDRVVGADVTIVPGTEVALAPGASLVFRNKVRILGTTAAPVRFTPLDPSAAPWGTVALHGQGTTGSEIVNVHMTGGSGDRIGLTDYIAMLSVHDTRDVRIAGVTLTNNREYDDTLHVVYGKDVTIENIYIEGAHSDAIDVDVSTVKIRGGRIRDAGNDALDFMASSALVSGITLTGAGDKGVSVGEGSEVLIYDTVLLGNGIGIESRDQSVALVAQSELRDNHIQLNAYWKNWRYGGGGEIEVARSLISGRESGITADNQSRILLRSNQISPPMVPSERIVFGNIAAQGSRPKNHGAYSERMTAAMERWRVDHSTADDEYVE